MSAATEGLLDRGHRRAARARRRRGKVHVQAAGGVRREARHRLLRLRSRAARVGRRARGRQPADHAGAHARAHAGLAVLLRRRPAASRGDTLFLDGCGRTDLPGGDPEALYESLTQKLAHVPDDTVLFPGHCTRPNRRRRWARSAIATTCSGRAPGPVDDDVRQRGLLSAPSSAPCVSDAVGATAADGPALARRLTRRCRLAECVRAGCAITGGSGGYVAEAVATDAPPRS